jgi:hypothetical protein
MSIPSYTEDQLDLLDQFIDAESDSHSNLFIEVWARIPDKKKAEIIENIETNYGTSISELEEQQADLENLDDDFTPFEDLD